MKKFLAIGAVLAALTSSVQAQYNESAVTSPDGLPIQVRQGQSVRWIVTGDPTDIISLRTPRTNIHFAGIYVSLAGARPGFINGERQLVVERVESLANNQIRVTLRHDPTKVLRMPNGSVSRTHQGEIIGGDVQLRRADATLIDSDPILSGDRLY